MTAVIVYIVGVFAIVLIFGAVCLFAAAVGMVVGWLFEPPRPSPDELREEREIERLLADTREYLRSQGLR